MRMFNVDEIDDRCQIQKKLFFMATIAKKSKTHITNGFPRISENSLAFFLAVVD